MKHLRILLVTLLTIVGATTSMAQTDTNWYIEYYGTDLSYHKVPMVYDEGSGSYTIEAEVLKNWGFWFKDSNDVYYGNTRPDSEKISMSNATDIPLGILANGGHDLELIADGTFTFTLRETADGIFLTITGWPIEPYAVLDGSTLTFYYDELKETRPGTKYNIPWNYGIDHTLPGWTSEDGNSAITTVDFHESFANYEDLTSTYGMFYGLSELTEINHLSRLRTDNVTNMSSMFEDCSKLETIDLSQFATFNVISMSAMFYDCSSLKSFSPSWQFDTGNVIDMAQMFSGCSSLESIDLGNFNTENVTNLVQMFYDCSRLTELDISNFNTAKVTNMNSLFMNCSSLTSLDVRNLNTANNSQFAMMFCGCSSLTSLDLTGFNTTRASWMLSMFENCTALTTIYCNDTWSCSGESDRMFSGCTNLHGAIDYDENKVDVTYANPDNGYFISQDVPYATLSANGKTLTFYYDKLKSSRTDKTYSIPWTGLPGWYGSTTITTANFDSSFATYTGLNSTENMFSEMKELVTINGLANLKTDNVTNMKNMFSGSIKLQNISGLTDFNTENVTNMSYMFSGCFALTTINVSSFNTENVDDMRGMFYNCSSLTTIYSEDDWSETWHRSTDMFKYDYLLKGAIEYDSNKTDATYANPRGYFSAPPAEPYAVVSTDEKTLTFYYDNKKGEKEGTKYNIPWDNRPGWMGTNITTATFDDSFRNYHDLTDASYMFAYLSNLSTINNLSYLHTSNVTNMKWMFFNCANIQDLNLSSFDTKKVNDMEDMFMYCSSLANLDISSFDTQNVTRMYGMFAGCNELTTLDLSNFNTEKVTNMYYMFCNCYDLQTLDISSFNTQKVTDMGYMFSSCRSLTNLDVSHFNTNNVYSMNAMFAGCSKLTTLDLSNFNTKKVTDMKYMFSQCTSLTTLDLSSFNTEKVTDMKYMFYQCNSLTKLDLAMFDTQKVTNMNGMFNGCSKLTTIYCNDDWDTGNVESTDMFTDCTQLSGGGFMAVYYKTNNANDITYANPHKYFTFKSYQPYGVLSTDGSTLTFYFDNQMYKREGTKYSLTWEDRPDWAGTSSNPNTTITTITFDDSFADAMYTNGGGDPIGGGYISIEYPDKNRLNLTNARNMFAYMKSLREINGLGYLLTGNVTNMMSMFENCSSLTSLDLRNFDTGKVTDMRYMFSGCSNLTTIYCNENWQKDDLQSTGMFRGCTQLAGAISFNSSITNADGANPNTGYFINEIEPYALLSTDNTTLTFYYDDRKTTREGTVYKIPWNGIPGWVPEEVLWGGENNSTITTVNFNDSFASYDGLTSTRCMFYFLDNLVEINGLDKLSTSHVTDMAGMFEGCSKLTTINLSSLNTSNATDMSFMFEGCSSLTTLDLSSLNTSNVMDMNHIFTNCTALTTLNLSGINTSNVTDMHNMFSYCTALTTLDLSSLNTSNVTSMASMFANCSNLTALDLSSFNTEKVTIMENMFYNCSSLESLDLSNFNTSNVTTMYEMFYNNSSLTSIDLSGFNTANVTTMSLMFQGCSSLTSLDVSNFNTEKVKYMDSMFKGCTNLVTIYCNDAWNTGTVTQYDNMFKDCTNLKGGSGTKYSEAGVTNITYAHPDGGTSNPGYFTLKTMPYAVLSTDCKTLTFYYDKRQNSREGTVFHLNTGNSMPDWAGMSKDHWKTITSVVFDSSFRSARPKSTSHWFDYLTGITSITNINYLNTSEVTDMSYMFSCCFDLENVSVSGFNTQNVTDMSHMFYYCESLTSLDVSGFNTEKVTNMSNMFYLCKTLTELDVNHFETQNVTNMSHMFDGLKGVSYLDLSYFDTHNVTDMSGMFSTCTNMATIDVSGFDTQKVTDMSSMFYNCPLLTELDLSSFDTKNVMGMEFMFQQCHALTSLDLSNFSTNQLVSIDGMFSGCSGLTTLDLCNFNVSNVGTWDDAVFDDCNSLTTIYAGDWASQLPAEALTLEMFPNCTSLTGGRGTTYDENHIYASYAHPDGGTANPGYFTAKNAFLPGDVNQDNRVDIADVTKLVNKLRNNEPADELSDIDGNGELNSSDTKALVNNVLGNTNMWWTLTAKGNISSNNWMNFSSTDLSISSDKKTCYYSFNVKATNLAGFYAVLNVNNGQTFTVKFNGADVTSKFTLAPGSTNMYQISIWDPEGIAQFAKNGAWVVEFE